MAPKKETAESKPKRVMTPQQLEKLAVARAKANEVRQAMKEGREDAQVAALQAKMDILKLKKKQKDPEPIPEEPEPTSEPTPDEELDPEKEDKIAKVEPVPVPEPEPTQANPPVEKLQCKKKKKKVIVMPNSDTSDSDDDSNVIFVKRSSRKKKPESVPTPAVSRQPSPIKTYRPPSNPFFNPMFSYGSRNFQ